MKTLGEGGESARWFFKTGHLPVQYTCHIVNHHLPVHHTCHIVSHHLPVQHTSTLVVDSYHLSLIRCR